MDLLLIQNTLSPVSSGRVGVNLCSHLHQFQQTPRYSSTLRDIESIKSNRRRQALPRRSATITTESQRVGILPTTTQQASSSTHAAASSSYDYYTPSPLGFGNLPSFLTVQDEGSRHNLSGLLRQLPDLASTQIIEQPQQQQPQLFTITTTAPPQQQQPPL